MYTKTLQQPVTQVAEMVKRLLSEGDQFHPLKGDREGRMAVRCAFTRVVEIILPNGESISGHTLDISVGGVGIVVEQPFPPNAKAIIKIQRLNGIENATFLAECRWCQDTGAGGIHSGWLLERVF